MRIGIDVGGTFTDMVLIDDSTGRVLLTKTLTTPKHLSEGVITGTNKILKIAGAGIKDVDYIVHGTTIGTNALLEKRGVKTGLITTDGFRDVLEIGRIQRPAEGLYDFSVDNPDPLVPRYLRHGVKERVDSKGKVVTPLDEQSVRDAVAALRKEGVASIAVCLLFAFLNPAHEKRVREICHEMAPEIFVSLSNEVAPEFREFERMSTTVISAYLQPIVQRYIETLQAELKQSYGRVDLRVMQASGGCMTADSARESAVQTVNSGPAGGAVAGEFIGKVTRTPNIVSVDMGGTSFDIGVIAGGAARITSEGKFDGYPLRISAVDVHAIGAGGGSIAWIDKGSVLNVGPKSAGADPGPACYGRGGMNPAVTDANLVLGRLNAGYFLGGEMKLDLERARQAVREHVAGPLKMSVEAAALGIVKVVNANMAKGIAVSTTQKGFDVREFALVAFGGAGPLHAVELAESLGMKTVIVPIHCGAFSALGLLVSDTRHDYVQTIMKQEENVKPAELTSAFRALEKKALAQLASENIRPKDMEVVWSADLRFSGQSYELNTSVKRKTLTARDIKAVSASFAKLHERIYAFTAVDEKVEFVNLRVTGIGKSPSVKIARWPRGAAKPPREAQKGKRPVFFEGRGLVQCPTFERALLRAGNRIAGPALIEETLSTTVVTAGAVARIDEFGNVRISL
ncbi:MAG: hydantoinase/oxoprolinase family protein [Planctomycetota bacterium]|nr:hydantoinase/oxoprolinase family protein [Planctomycetota bacterium]